MVVKVQRAGAAEQVKIDLQILERLARRVARNASWARQIGVVEIIDGFAQSVREELDYHTEVDNLAALRDGLRADGVRVPGGLRRFVQRVIVMVVCFDCTPLARAGRWWRNCPSMSGAIARTYCCARCSVDPRRGVFHADLHSGNVVIWSDGQVGLLDFGSVGRLDAPARRNLGLLLVGGGRRRPGAGDRCRPRTARPRRQPRRTCPRANHGGADHPGARRGNRRQPRLLPAGTEGRFAARHQCSQQHRLGIALSRLTRRDAEDSAPPARPDRQCPGFVPQCGGGHLHRWHQARPLNQAVRTLPLLTQLPRRLNRITDELQNGRFTTHMRIDRSG